MMPDIRHWHGNEFRKGPWAIYADSLRVFAQMPPPGQTIPASTANDMPFGAHNVAAMKIDYVRPDLDDFADELMPHHHGHRNRLLRPGIPFINMQICSANPGAIHANQHIVDPNL